MSELIIDTKEPKYMERKFSPYHKVKVENLPIGDYKCGNVIIERKTIADFVGSMRGHLQKQMMELQQYEHPYVIIIGYYEELFTTRELAKYYMRYNTEWWIGSLASINVRYGHVKVINVKTENKFISLVNKIIEKTSDNKNPLYNTEIMRLDKQIPIKDRKALMLTSIPGVSLGKAKELLKYMDIEFKHKKRGDKMKLNDVLTCDGFGDITAESVMKVIG